MPLLVSCGKLLAPARLGQELLTRVPHMSSCLTEVMLVDAYRVVRGFTYGRGWVTDADDVARTAFGHLGSYRH